MLPPLTAALLLIASLPPVELDLDLVPLVRGAACPHCDTGVYRADSATWFCGACKVTVEPRFR